jgi:hypothetical protein
MTRTIVALKTGTLEGNNNLDGWIITSKTATLHAPDDDLVLHRGDRIGLDGWIYRDGYAVARIGN